MVLALVDLLPLPLPPLPSPVRCAATPDTVAAFGEVGEQAEEVAQQAGELIGEELATDWPEERPSLLCEGERGNLRAALNIAK